MIRQIFKLFLLHVVLARPTDSASSQEHETAEETEEDSGPSSLEEGDKKDDVFKEKEKNKDISYAEIDCSHDDYFPLMPSLEMSHEESLFTENSEPRPPSRKTYLHGGLNLHENVEVPTDRYSAMSLDGYSSEVNRDQEGMKVPLSSGPTPRLSFSALSADDLTLDARACARPRRKKKNTETKALGKPKLYGNLKYKDREENIQRQGKEVDNGSIEDFIKQLVSSQLQTKPNILFFDAAIVYEKEDYLEALNFKEEMMMIVKSEYDEEIRIELYDSAVFAQSKVCVVQDVVDKCSMIFVYLTNNFRSPELKFFVEEAIGICRLELGNENTHRGFVHNDRQWTVKPIHTAPPKMRAYKVPSGLLTVSGIDWYDKHTAYTQNQIRAVVRTAYNTRKKREMEANLSEGLSTSQMNLVKQNPSDQTRCTPKTIASAKVLSRGTDIGIRRQQDVSSNTSVDALSLMESMSQSASLQNQPNENFPERMYSMQSRRDDLYDLQPDSVAGHYGTMKNTYGQMVNANRSLPVNTVAYNQLQTGQYPHMSPHVEQYLRPPRYQNSNIQQRYVVQTSSIQGRNAQNPSKGNVSNLMNNPVHPGCFNGPNSNPQIGMTEASYTGIVQTGSRQSQNFIDMLPNYGHQIIYPQPNTEYRMTNPQLYQPMNMQMQGHSSNNQLPLPQQNAYFHQPTRYHQNQAVSRDAYPREPGNFLLDQRNDAPPTSQLSVVSKITGSLIVNPNLSTDDVEVDHGISTDTSGTKSRSSRAKHKLSSKKYDSEDSSSESECELTKPSKGKRVKKKVVTVIGSKIVQIGRKNKVVESGNDKNQQSETSAMLESKCDQISMQSSIDNIGNSPSKASEDKDTFKHHVENSINTTSDINVLSTDNMSMERNFNSMSTSKEINGKLIYEKFPETSLGKDDQRLDDRRVELFDINARGSDNVTYSQMNIISNDRYSRGYSQKFTSIKYHGSDVEDARGNPLDDRLNENEDRLFESGSYDSNIPNENNIIMARFSFSRARKGSVSMLGGSNSFFKTRPQNMYHTNDTDEID